MKRYQTEGVIFFSMWLVCFLVESANVSAAQKPVDKGVIQGTVRDQQNPLYGILITAKADGKNSLTSVFTDELGEYVFPPLPVGNYILSVGTKWQEKVTLDSSPVKKDFVVELGAGFFNQTSGDSYLAMLPGTDMEKENIVNNCGSCHSVWRLLDRGPNSPEGWTNLVRRMGLKKGGEGSEYPTVAPRVDMSDKNFHWLTNYYSDHLKPELKQRQIVEAMFRPRGEGARAVFAEWNLPIELGGINTAKPDSKGRIWFPSGQTGSLGRLDPRTGEVQSWKAPLEETAKGEEPPLHDIMIDKEDHVWLSGGGKNVVLKFDSKTL